GTAAHSARFSTYPQPHQFCAPDESGGCTQSGAVGRQFGISSHGRRGQRRGKTHHGGAGTRGNSRAESADGFSHGGGPLDDRANVGRGPQTDRGRGGAGPHGHSSL